ncbi:hypothetical protein F7725_023054 [Dissostichus mawsoni]|uniref:Uncharacterized protein n=1 Tax=Dissostichus mawsoni TaxID=36200 RepID=A0A7J5Z1S5_DISMA|nr:hypothetical protein F7725_023054 [Dissostichus mawsoni]
MEGIEKLVWKFVLLRCTLLNLPRCKALSPVCRHGTATCAANARSRHHISARAICIARWNVRGGKQETLCAHIDGPTKPVKLTITLEMGRSKTTILEQAVDKDFYRCLNFQV